MADKRISPDYLGKKDLNSSLTYSLFSSVTTARNAIRQANKSLLIFNYESFFEILYTYSFSIVSDPILLKDTLQDLFVELRERKRYFRKTNTIKFYLFSP